MGKTIFQHLHIGIFVIEPWLNGSYFDVVVAEDLNTIPNDKNWYWKGFQHFKGRPSLMYSASYDVPKALLK